MSRKKGEKPQETGNPEFSSEAECYKRCFEKVLCQAMTLSDSIITREVWQLGEVVEHR